MARGRHPIQLGALVILAGCGGEGAVARKLVGEWDLPRYELHTSQVGGGHGGETIEEFPLSGAAFVFEDDGTGFRALEGSELAFFWEPSGGDQFTIAADDAFVFEIHTIEELDRHEAVFWTSERYSFSGTEGLLSTVYYLER